MAYLDSENALYMQCKDTPVSGIQIHDSVDLNMPWSIAVREGREIVSEHDAHCVSLICAAFKNFQSMNSP